MPTVSPARSSPCPAVALRRVVVHGTIAALAARIAGAG